MTVSFPTLAANLREPGVFVEFDPSQANQGPLVQPYEVLMIGEKTSAGSATASAIDVITSADQAKELYGQGSSMHIMSKKYFAANGSINKLYGASTLPAGTAGTHTIQASGTATEAGTIALYIHGERIEVSVANGDDANTVAAAIDAAVTAYTGDLMCTSGVSTDTVTLTGRHASVLSLATEITVQHSLGETEKLPAGVSLAIVQDVISGSGLPTLTTIISNMGEDQFNLIIWPYGSQGGASQDALTTELLDRYGPIRQVEGVAIGAVKDSQANLLTYGDGENSQFFHSIGCESTMPSASMEVAAAAVGVAAKSLQADPARPLQSLVLSGIVPAPREDRFTYTERNLQLQDGVATQYTDDGGLVRISRLISNYQTNSSGLPDTAFLDIQTFATLSYIRFQIRARWSSRYPRHKLAGDASAKRFGPGQAVMTPSLAKSELVAMFMEWEELALVEDLDDFKDNLVVEINSSDPNRLDVLLPPNLVNQLRVSAFNVQFRL